MIDLVQDLVYTVLVMKKVTIHEAKTHLSRLLSLVQAGEMVIIAKNNRPIARLVAYEAALTERPIGLYKGRVVMGEDWDAPLPDEFRQVFGA